VALKYVSNAQLVNSMAETPVLRCLIRFAYQPP